MSATIYDISIPPLVRQLRTLSTILTIAEKWCDEKKKPHSYLLEGSLTPDMYNLGQQVHVTLGTARNCVFTNDWTYVYAYKSDGLAMSRTFKTLQDGIAEMIQKLESVKPEDIIDRPFEFWVTGVEGQDSYVKFGSSVSLLTQFNLPNFYFHMITAYDICRMLGVPLGKRDFLMGNGVPFT